MVFAGNLRIGLVSQLLFASSAQCLPLARAPQRVLVVHAPRCALVAAARMSRLVAGASMCEVWVGVLQPALWFLMQPALELSVCCTLYFLVVCRDVDSSTWRMSRPDLIVCVLQGAFVAVSRSVHAA